MLAAALTLLLGIIVTLAIIAACGFFVAQEFAYMSVDRSRLAAKAEKGDAQAKRVLAITKRTSFMLSGAQLGITVTGLLIGYVAEPLIGESLGTLLGGVGIDPAVSVLIGTIGALLLATVVTMIFGELYPKNLAIASPEPLARALAVPTRIYLLLFGWLITVFDVAANALLRLLRIEPLEDVDESATARDLEAIIEESRVSGDLPDDLSMIIDRILDFPQRDVEHAMIPRSQIDSVTPDTTVGEVRALMATGHTRYPVIGDEGSPVGVIELIDVLREQPADDAPVASVMRAAVVIPTSMLLPVALDRMRRSRNELACVVDEYGNFDGILTIEDLTEEVIGELSDEHDVEVAEVSADGDDAWTVPGDLHLDELERLLGHDLAESDVETVAGLVIETHGDLPAVGSVIRIDLPERASETVQGLDLERWLAVEVVEVDRHVPSQLKIRLHEVDRDAEPAVEASAIDEEVAR
ncbi:CBS domain containing-hemolysin-like protein [Microbacterium testaceum]|uniref:hemolysin family protein n=1 Tax=Microbacterium TaxID=33882 RepID=UPI002782DF03|nr:MULTISPECIES: hemolysin family protein [Microbacterium]MDQ1113781.1 CBS domain containing-hemolysin-like protein [Microbacterium testaceum]MDR6099114.1 CBS domain containing-hemolysin-like protein [Microbacterium sp. SORGH_AS_0454]